MPTPKYELSEIETKLIFQSGGKMVIIPDINKVSNKTASLELKELERKRLLDIQGKGRSTKYIPKI